MIGLTGGVFNLCTNLAGIVMPIIIGIIVQQTGSFYGGLAFITPWHWWARALTSSSSERSGASHRTAGHEAKVMRSLLPILLDLSVVANAAPFSPEDAQGPDDPLDRGHSL